MLAQTIVTAILLFLLVGVPSAASALSVTVSSGGSTVTPSCTGAGPNPVPTRTMTLSCSSTSVNGVTVGPQNGDNVADRGPDVRQHSEGHRGQHENVHPR